jgi:hypothetical protein
MSAQFKKSNADHAGGRSSLGAHSNMTIRDSERSSTQGQEQNSVLGAFHGSPQSSAAVVRERNAPRFQTQTGTTSVNQTESQDPALQMSRFAIASNEEKAQTTASPAKLEHSRRKMDELADENARLRNELKALQNERATVPDVDEMLSDLITTQKELEEKKDELMRKESELLALRREVDRLSTELDGKTPQFTKMENLFKQRYKMAMENKETELLDLQQKVNRLSAELEQKAAMPKNETEVLGLRQKVSQLTTDLGEKEEQLRHKDDALTKQEVNWKAKLQDTRERLEVESRERHESMRAKMAEQQKQREDAEGRLKELQAKQHSVDPLDENRRLADSKEAATLAQVEVEKRKAEQYRQELRKLRTEHAIMSQAAEDSSRMEIDSQALQQMQASHAAELEELRRMSNFFKNNSERLSKQIKEEMATSRRLQDSVQAKNREVEDQRSLIQAQRLQIEEFRNRFSR